MTIHRKLTLAASLACAFAVSSMQADSLLSYGFSNTTPFAPVITTASGVTATAVAISGTALTATPAAQRRTYADAADGWATGVTNALTSQSFVNLVTFTSTSDATFDHLSIGLMRPSGDTSTLNYALVYVLNSGAVTNPGTLTGSIASTQTTASEVNFNLTGITDFDLVSAGTTVQFRLAVFSTDGVSDTTSDLIFRNVSGGVLGVTTTITNGFLNLEGTLSAVPEPSTYAMFGSIIALGVAVYYRRKSC